MSNVLIRILARKREEVAERRRTRPLAELTAQAADLPAPRGFAATLKQAHAAGRPAVIAEIKRASPSKGLIRSDFDPAAIAKSYQAGGASGLSVLTDRDYFQGSEAYLQAAREACQLPVLRKDFIIDPYQVYETRVIGADAILLIVAALTDDALTELAGLAAELKLDVLCEVHDEAELARAQGLPEALLGVNNRDLRNFETHLDTTLHLREVAGPERFLVSESGIHTQADVTRLRAAGVQAFLIGEAFMRADDPGAALHQLFAV